MVIKIGAVYAGMTSCTETRAFRHASIMITIPYPESIGISLCLEVTSKTEIRVPCNKKFVVH